MSSAGIVIIGNEILTGKVQDENTPYLLRELRRQGVDVPRVHVISDVISEIARACGDDLVCAKCGVRIVSGRVAREAPVERRAKARNRVAPELRLACALRVQGNLELSADYW